MSGGQGGMRHLRSPIKVAHKQPEPREQGLSEKCPNKQTSIKAHTHTLVQAFINAQTSVATHFFNYNTK